MKDIRRVAGKYFDYSGTDKFFDIVVDLVERIDKDDFKEDSYEAAYQACDEGLIYTADQWEMLEHYCTPQDADFDEMWKALIGDVMAIAEEAFDSSDEE